MKKRLKENKSGFSLIEILVSLFILMILTLGIYSLIVLSLKLNADNKSYVEATEIANQKMEIIRNMPYDDVGVVSGIPSGSIPQVETISRGNKDYTVNNYVTFYDDPYDGTIAGGTDSIGVDYKIVTVKVSWEGKFGAKNITVFSKVIPRTEETTSGYGLLKIHVLNVSGQPVDSANINVKNVSLGVDVDNLSDSDGILYLPALADFQGYRITVTKSGYGQDQSYDPSAGLSPIDLSVTDGDKTEESFTIDKLAHLNFQTVSNNLPDNWMVNEDFSTSTRSRISPRLDIDSLNNIYFTWEDYSATSSYVFVQKYNSSGVKQWSSDKKIYTSNFQKNPDIKTMSSGKSFVVWQDNSLNLKSITKAKEKTRLVKNETFPNFDVFYNLNISNSTPFNLIKNKNNNFKSFLLKTANTFLNKTAYAAGTVNIIQTKTSSAVNWSSSLSASFNSTPTAGNVLIAIAMRRNSSGHFNSPSNSSGGFSTAIHQDPSGNPEIGIWYKIAGASEPSQVNISATATMRGGRMIIMEISGLDTSNLIDVVKANDETGSTSNTSYSGATGVSTNNGFAIAVSGFADNNFTTANSSNWTSDSSDIWSQTAWTDWSTGRDGTIAVATMDITQAVSQGATLTLSGGGPEERDSAIAIFNVINPDNITVSVSGNQVSNITSSNSSYIGGYFSVIDNTGAHTISSIKISENGTIDAQNDITGVELYYDIDSSAPYDCSGETYDSGSDSQFGASETFDSSDGQATFSDSVNIDTTHSLCLYVVLTPASDAPKNDTIEIEIRNPENDLVSSSGDINPDSTLEINGTTFIDTPAELKQIAYRFRNDDGDENGASWLYPENNSGNTLQNKIIRLRLEIYNPGSLSSASTQYKLQYAKKISSCSAASTWIDLPTNSSLAWQIVDSSNLNDSSPSTNISGLSDYGSSFVAGELKDTSNLSSALVLNDDDFTEFEYSIEATTNASEDSYCFRLSGADSYDVYPELSVTGDENIYISALDSSGSVLWSNKRVNVDSGSSDQSNPRIAISENGSIATTTIVWEDNRNGNKDIYLQSFDSNGVRLWASDKQITSSSTDETSPSIIINNNDEIIITWVDESLNGKKIYADKLKLDDGSSLWGSPKLLVGGTLDSYDPEIAIDSSDNIYLAWTEDNAGDYDSLFGKWDTDANLIWSYGSNLEESNKNQTETAISVLGGDLFLSWTDDRENEDNIFAQKYDLSGTAQWTEDLKIDITTTPSDQNNSALAIISTGECIGVWQDNRDGGYNIYATNFDDPGTLSAVANVPLIIHGEKLISNNPKTYEFNQNYSTDASGQLSFDAENDAVGYSVEIDSGASTLNIILRDPPEPMPILPDETKTMILYVE